MFGYSSAENVFRVIPEEKAKERRGVELRRALANTDEMLKKLAKDFFQPQIVVSLTNPATCLFKLRDLIDGSTYMQNLSDFVVVCFIFVYKNPTTRRQALSFLRDKKIRNFKFSQDELEVLVTAIVDTPPTNTQDVTDCAEIIAQFCEEDGYCLRIVLAMLKQHYGDVGKRPVLTATAKLLARFGENAMPQRKDFALVNEWASGKVEDIADLQPVPAVTPVQQRMQKIQMERKISRFFDSCQATKVFWYVLMSTFVVIVGVIIL